MNRTTGERPRSCNACKKPLLLSREGYRCLNCPHVFCRKCAPGHFGTDEGKVQAMDVLKSMIVTLHSAKFLKLVEKCALRRRKASR